MSPSKLPQILALLGVVTLGACANQGVKMRDGWAVRQAADIPSDQVPLLHKDKSVAASVEHTQLQMIATTANQIALASEEGSAVYLVEMSDPTMVNAFAWRDKNGIGYIGVTLPMARALGTDADRWAALLGHETGHLAKDHQKANAARQASLQATATALGFIPLPVVGALARAVVVPVAATAVNAHYSRDQEREADAVSVEYMSKAGFDPQGAVRLQQTLLSVAGNKGGGFFASHPGGQERIKNLEAEIYKLPHPPVAAGGKP